MHNPARVRPKNRLEIGPLTWLRPAVAVAGAILAGAAGADPPVWACAGLAVAAVLAVEPLAGQLWYAPGSRQYRSQGSGLLF